MIPNGAMGANQAIESSVVLMNELQEALRDEGNCRCTSSSLAEASAQYTEIRRTRAQMALRKAAMASTAQNVL